MKQTIATLTLGLIVSLVGTSNAQLSSGTSAGFGSAGQAIGTATYQGDQGFAHSLSDQRSGFVRSSAVGVSKRGEISYSRSMARKNPIQASGSNLQILNGSQGSHYSSGEITTIGAPKHLKVQGHSQLDAGRVRGGATLLGTGGLINARTFSITNQPRFQPRFPGVKPIWTP